MADTQEQLLNQTTALSPTEFVRTVSSPDTTPDSTVMLKSDFVDSLFADSVSFSLTMNADDLIVTGLSTSHVLRLSSSGSVDVTGLQTGKGGRILIIHNVGSSTITLVDESVLSNAVNRFALTANIALAPDTMVILQYDATSTRWRAAGGGGGGGSSGHTIQEEGASLAARSKLNFIGAGVTATDNLANDATDVTVVINETTLSTSDVTTGDVSTTKHGFTPKAPNSATSFLDGLGAWDTVKDSDLSLSDIATNNVSTVRHGFMSKLPGQPSKSFRGDGSWIYTPQVDGWVQHTDSAFSNVSSYVFQVSGDYSVVFRKGTRVVWNDSGGWKYGIVLSVTYSAPNTQVTLFTNSDYVVAAGMTALYFSYEPYPAGFPSVLTYTPSTSAITLGNGTLSGKFFVLGSQVFGDYSLKFGTTTAFTGSIYIGFPCTINQAAYFVTGNVSLVDWATALYTGIQLADTSIRLMNTAGTYAIYGYVNATAPFTWANTDALEGSFRFRY